MNELSRALDDYVKTGDLVLLKGSRGCALESLTEILTKNGEAQRSCAFADRGESYVS